MLWIFDKFKIHYRKLKFKKNALLSDNVSFGPNAKCVNNTKNINNIRIGNNSYINGTIYTVGNGKISIGHHFYIGPNSMIGSANDINIGNYVIISNDVKIYDNNNHPTSSKKREEMLESGFHNDNWSWIHAENSPIIIEDSVWVGQYVTILKGVRVGKGSIVATRAVVTKDVPPYSIVAGNPAKVVKHIE